ncbi:MAG: multifunctional 2-oxoglutarate metabolism enzyme, partial [Candidatus Eremiobacteraeota bacterium]|nr:multifunctional 2-oxoglutarate metabolism enzyme [Candidatus Eremiobacteraeota bacterium]
MTSQTLVNVTLPEMGESVSEGSIVEWRKKVGDWVEDGETLVDITTDKVDVEVPSTASGVVTALHGDEGSTIPVGAVLVEIDTTAAKPEGASAGPGTAAPATANANATPSAAAEPAPKATATPSVTLSLPKGAPPSAPSAGNGKPGGTLSHHARRLVDRLHIDATKLTGTGPDGLILREDVEAAVASGKIAFTGGPGAASDNVTLSLSKGAPPSAPAAVNYPPAPADAKVTDLKGSVATLASYMEQSLSIPVATSFRTLHVGTLEQRRAELNAALKQAGRTEKISFTHVIAYALARAARELPAITASFRRVDGKPQRVEAGVNLGLAVDAQKKDGSRFLVVPVLKNAAALDFAQFRDAYEDLVAKARDNKLSVEEQTGATFTLTNPGGIGTVASVPRLMVGQGAIIAAGAIAYPPGFAHASRTTLEQIGVEKVMTLTSTYDHRVIQGAQSGEYLKRVDELLGGADEFYETVFAQLGVSASVRAAQPASANGAAAPVREVAEAVTADIPGMPSEEMLRAIAAGMAIVSAYRRHGHLGATLDPLGTEPPNDPSLDPATYNLTPAMMNAIPASVLNVKVPGKTLADVLPRLRETYSSTIAYEIEHISNTAKREWLRDYIERGQHRRALTPQRRVQVLQRLTKVETMERYFRKQFMSQKTFSIEGLDVMVPMLEETISLL